MIEALQIAIIFLCLCGSSFFSGMETGVTAINRLRLKHFVRLGDKSARILDGFLEDSDRLLGTTLTGNNLCLVVISVLSASLAARRFGSWAETVSSLIVSIVVLIFGEYLPKAWFSGNPYFRVNKFAGVLRTMESLLKPISIVMVAITRILVPGAKKSFAKPLPFVSREDIKMLTRASEKSGVLSRRETWMISRVFELSGKTAAQIMIPRDRMLTVDKDVLVEDFLETARTSGVTRMPVYDKATDEFVGIINVLHVLAALPNAKGRKIVDMARPPQFLPAKMPVDDIFPKLRLSRQPMALVRRDGEEVVGLITTEDILEEIVGEL